MFDYISKSSSITNSNVIQNPLKSTAKIPSAASHNMMKFQKHLGNQSLTQLMQHTNPAHKDASLIHSKNTSVMQRVTIIMDYSDTDSMQEAALENIKNPMPIFLFDENGNFVATPKEITKKFNSQTEDNESLNIISHGGVGTLASISVSNINKFFENEQLKKIWGKEISKVHLGACYAMMKMGEEDSVAFKVAKWIQTQLSDQQKVTLHTGYTTNTVGEFFAGKASFLPLNIETVLSVHQPSIYNYVVSTILDISLPPDNESKRKELQNKLSEKKDDILDKISECIDKFLEDKKINSETERIEKQKFLISNEQIENQEILQKGYAIIKVTRKNKGDFANQLTVLLNELQQDQSNIFNASDIQTMLQNCVDQSKEEVKQLSSPASFASQIPLSQPKFFFGYPTPKDNVLSQENSTQPTNFGFYPVLTPEFLDSTDDLTKKEIAEKETS